MNLKAPINSIKNKVKTFVGGVFSVNPNLYHSCSELPLYIFITCVCDKNYSGLVKHGKVKESDTLKAWELIYCEFIDLSDNPAAKQASKLSREIAVLESKLRAIGYCLLALQYFQDKDCIDLLRTAYHFNYAFDFSNPVQYAKDLESVSKRTGSIVFSLQQKRSEEKRENEMRSKSKPMTRKSFQDQLTAIGKHMNQRIDPLKWTVLEYISAKNSYEEEIKALNRANEKEKLIINGAKMSNIYAS